MYRIGIDVGGTFTDLVAIDEAGATILAKVPSTPQDPSLGVLDGLALLAGRLGLERAALLGATERIVHGTTVATNALLEKKGARTGLLTTKGHRDVIEMREGLKDDRYNLRMAPPEQLVPRHLRLGVEERMRADGRVDLLEAVAVGERRVETPLDPASLDDAIRVLREERVEAVAVCYLHAWRDPSHERATREALYRALPAAYVALSSEVLPQIKEFERVSTTIINAYVGPGLSRYLTRLEERLGAAGYRGPTLIIQSHGGVAPIAEAGRLAVGGGLSGPAGGVAGSVYAARLIGERNLIPFDMGGTSTDISLVVDGAATLVMNRRIGAHQIALNSLDIASIGAGGGSIARVDAGGILHVGPDSAGAVPGPACYGQGGTAATVTDANLVLGYLDPGNFLGGERKLEPAAAERAVDQIAAALGIARVSAARGIHRIINTTMAEGVRLVSVRRGVDPRGFALFAFGGAVNHLDDDAQAFADVVRFQLGLFALGQTGFGAAHVDDQIRAFRALDDDGHEFADTVVILVENGVAFGFAHFLQNNLLGGLRGDTSEHVGRLGGDDFRADFYFGIFFLGVSETDFLVGIRDLVNNCVDGKNVHLAGFLIEFGAQIFFRLVIFSRGHNHGVFNSRDDHFRLNVLFATEHFNLLVEQIRHFSLPRVLAARTI